ncbi:hypothetical protein SAMN04244553_1747 [Nocardia amikacinitolerans]|uniref:Uncharacterized protein n=1 Tax=Nocardia amikacinitolerans TaxID=756689 RepID=A0A285L902_9NOCA|nr:hypothetical protein [Nocardia amikacinitolerans]MCP2277796.1 hypothetical protein [Nocardia amikacinitolerans]MCP2297866.1 hypothetical protein [Nocardia amikacinitolerans]MCP2315620.1 hypothetical protein [Nocardia amikacinitolerans]SNY79861.1 hypothetical protein SAMN04244553_1747 [Nocardia amikacinitolerans]
MADAIHRPGVTSTEDRVPALQGLLVAESEREITVRVAEGTWTFRRDDVLRMLDNVADDQAGDGRPVLVDIRPGATADFTQRLRIDLVDRPMTIAAAPSEALGDELLQQLTATWADRLRLVDYPAGSGATYTYCQTKSFATSDDGINCDSLD